jgi:hypothetical protein
MEFLAGIEILFKAASAAGFIFKASQFMYHHIKKVKNPQELMTESKQMFGAVNKRLDELSVGTDQLSDNMEGFAHTITGGFDQLSGNIEGLANITISGFGRVSEAFSQVIAL